MMLIYDEHEWSACMIIVSDDHTWNHRMGYTPENANLTGNYRVKLTFSQKTCNDPISDGIISIRAIFPK